MNASARIVVSEVFEEAVVKKTKTFDRLDFRKALGSFPTGVTIISARTAEGRTRRRYMQQLQLGFSGPAFDSVEPSQELIQSSRI